MFPTLKKEDNTNLFFIKHFLLDGAGLGRAGPGLQSMNESSRETLKLFLSLSRALITFSTLFDASS